MQCIRRRRRSKEKEREKVKKEEESTQEEKGVGGLVIRRRDTLGTVRTYVDMQICREMFSQPPNLLLSFSFAVSHCCWKLDGRSIEF